VATSLLGALECVDVLHVDRHERLAHGAQRVDREEPKVWWAVDQDEVVGLVVAGERSRQELLAL
jgi:hypothetical protein